MHSFLKLLAAFLAASCLLAPQAFAAELYTYMYGNNTWTGFYGPSGDFGINSYPRVQGCGSGSAEAFFQTLSSTEGGPVLVQTYPCGEYLKVCIDPNVDDGSFDPVSCGTFVWDSGEN